MFINSTLGNFFVQVLMLGVMLFPASVLAQSSALEYRFHWGKVPVANFKLTLPSVESQVVRVEGSTVGLVGKIFNYDGAIESDYSDMKSVVFRLSGTDNDFEEYRTINFYPDRPAEVVDFLDDELPPPARELVESMGITVDPFRAMLALIGDATEGCSGRYSVYDGKRHYKLGLAAGRRETLEADRDWTYAGEAIRCDLSISYMESSVGNEQNPWFEEDSEDRSVWLAEIDSKFVPVLIEMPGPIGRIVGRVNLLDIQN